MAEGQHTNRWKLEFGKLSFTISRGSCIAKDVNVFFLSDAFVTCCCSLWVSPPSKSRDPEVLLQPLLSVNSDHLFPGARSCEFRICHFSDYVKVRLNVG